MQRKNEARLVCVPRRRLTGLAILFAVAGLSLAAAPSSSAVYKAFWGPTKQPNGSSAFPIYKDLGVNIYQAYIRWDVVAPIRPANPRNHLDPAYRWPADLAYAVQQAKQYKMRVALMVLYSPSWANGGRAAQWAPKNPNDYADFMYAASKHYPDIHLYMVWGEPSRKGNWQPLTPQPDSRANAGKPLNKAEAQAPRIYASILDATYVQLKSASKQNLVIGGNTFSWGDIRPVQYVKNMRFGPKNQKPRLDFYGQNPFTNRKPDLKRNKPFCGTQAAGCADFSDLNWFGKVVDQNLGTKTHAHVPLFVSEWTVPTRKDDSEFPFYVSPATQASWISAAFGVARSVNAYAFGWVHLYDEAPDPYGGRKVISGGLLYSGGTKKPGYAAFKKG
jgi:hypothetical protein